MNMVTPEIWPFAWKEFSRSKSRHVISIAGFALSVIVFVLVLTILRQSNKALGFVLTHTGTHFIGYKPQCCAPPFFSAEAQAGFFANGVPSQPFNLNVLAEIRALPTVADASPFLCLRIVDNNQTTVIGGFDPANSYAVASTCCAAGDLITGRFLQADDRGNVMLDESFAVSRSLNPESSFEINGISYHIVGIVTPGIRPARVDVYMTFADAERLISRYAAAPVRDLMNIVLVESDNAHAHSQAVAEVQRVLGRTGLISSYGCYRPASTALMLHGKALQALSVVIFLFAALLAMKTQISIVRERRRDIGILSATGWSRAAITKLICYQSLIPAALGALIGAAGVVVMVYLLPLGRIAGTEPAEFPLRSIFTAMLVILLSGVVAGVDGDAKTSG